MQEYIIAIGGIIFLVALLVWGNQGNHKQRLEQRKSLDDLPFGSVSSEEKIYELNNLYQANETRSQRNLDS